MNNFDIIKGYISLERDKKNLDLAVLNGLLLNNGCSLADCDAIINGCIKDVILDCVSTLEPPRVTASNGNILPNAPYHPTEDELIDEITNFFAGIPIERAKKIVNYLLKNQALSYTGNGTLYRSKSMVPNNPLSL